VIKLKNASGVTIENVSYYDDQWNNAPTALPHVVQASGNDNKGFPGKAGR
jgi:hypothetical protein